MRLSVPTAVAALAAVLACGGCGLGPGAPTKGVSVTVTGGFGSRHISTVSRSKVPGSETVMRMLERSFKISTRYGGGFVESIDGLAPSGARSDWFYYVNGVQASKGAATTAVHAGDHIWWDLHNWSATENIPAVVGSFPEPFTNGIGGKRYPVTLECASDVTAGCQQVTKALNAQHVPVSSQLLGTGSGPATLGLVVGTWREIRSEVAAELVAHGPGASGVYARALTPEALRDHFALAVDGATRVPVPIQASP